MSGRVYQGDNETLRGEGKLSGRKNFFTSADVIMSEAELLAGLPKGVIVDAIDCSKCAQGYGGSTPSLYALPAWARELQDLIEHREMNFAVGNIFKACYRLGRKDGVDAAYDLRKILFFAERELRRVEAMNEKV